MVLTTPDSSIENDWAQHTTVLIYSNTGSTIE